MNVLVTGGTGFLGGYLMAALEAAGHAAFAFDVAPPSPEMLFVSPSLAARFRAGQIGDFARLFEVCRSERIEAIVHTAGMVGLEHSLAQPLATYQTNIMGLVHACEAARQLGMRKLIAISSNAAYHKGSGERLSETDPPFSVTAGNPAAHYGTSKMAAEAIGMAYATFQDLDLLSLRITAIYGFGMRSPMYIKPMVENAVRGVPTRFATGGPMKRDYTHVLDCCRRHPAGAGRAAARGGRATRAQCRGRPGVHGGAGRRSRAPDHTGRRDRDRRYPDAARSRECQDARPARHRGGEARARLDAAMAAGRRHPAIRRALPALSRASGASGAAARSRADPSHSLAPTACDGRISP